MDDYGQTAVTPEPDSKRGQGFLQPAHDAGLQKGFYGVIRDRDLSSHVDRKFDKRRDLFLELIADVWLGEGKPRDQHRRAMQSAEKIHPNRTEQIVPWEGEQDVSAGCTRETAFELIAQAFPDGEPRTNYGMIMLAAIDYREGRSEDALQRLSDAKRAMGMDRNVYRQMWRELGLPGFPRTLRARLADDEKRANARERKRRQRQRSEGTVAA